MYSRLARGTCSERAGALTRVTADGEHVPKGDPGRCSWKSMACPTTRPARRRRVCWLGHRRRRGLRRGRQAPRPPDRPAFEDREVCATIYERILGLTAQESGASMPIINEAVDNDELLKSSPFVRAPLHRQAGEMRRRGMARQELAHYRGRPRGKRIVADS